MLWCLRPADAAGHPPRSEYFADRLQQCRSEPQLRALFLSVVQVALYLRRTTALREANLIPKSPTQRFWELSGLEAPNWEAHQVLVRSRFDELSRAAADIDPRATPEGTVKIFLCVDQAAELVVHSPRARPPGELLNMVRRAARSLGITLVLSDTRCSIATSPSDQLWNTFPVRDFHRDAAETPPLQVAPACTPPVPYGVRALPLEFDAEHLLILGRPLWLTEAEWGPLSLRRFAVAKLLDSVHAPKTLEIDPVRAAAIVSARCSLIFGGTGFDPSPLVASHMATCTGRVEEQIGPQPQVFACYGPEPVLAEASALVLGSRKRLLATFTHLSLLWKQGPERVLQGVVIAQLAACLAKDSLVRLSDRTTSMSRRLYTAEVPALDFLSTFCELGR